MAMGIGWMALVFFLARCYILYVLRILQNQGSNIQESTHTVFVYEVLMKDCLYTEGLILIRADLLFTGQCRGTCLRGLWTWLHYYPPSLMATGLDECRLDRSSSRGSGSIIFCRGAKRRESPTARGEATSLSFWLLLIPHSNSVCGWLPQKLSSEIHLPFQQWLVMVCIMSSLTYKRTHYD